VVANPNGIARLKLMDNPFHPRFRHKAAHWPTILPNTAISIATCAKTALCAGGQQDCHCLRLPPGTSRQAPGLPDPTGLISLWFRVPCPMWTPLQLFKLALAPRHKPGPRPDLSPPARTSALPRLNSRAPLSAESEQAHGAIRAECYRVIFLMILKSRRSGQRCAPLPPLQRHNSLVRPQADKEYPNTL